MPWAGALAQTQSRTRCAIRRRSPPPRKQRAGVPLDGGKQAVANLAFGREPQPIAIAAERLRHRIDKPDRAAAVGKLEIDGRLAGIGPRDGQRAGQTRLRAMRRIFIAVEHVVRCQCCSASSGMNSMNRSSRPRSRAKRPSGTISSSVRPRIATALSRICRSPPRCAAAMPASTRSSPWRRVDLLESLLAERIEADVQRCRPGRRSAAACSASRMPLVVRARSSMPGMAASISTNCGRSARTSGSPPVSRSSSHAQLRHDAHEAGDLLERENLVARQEPHVLVRHAVEAADIAAVGDADPQARVHAAERVDQRRMCLLFQSCSS